MKLTLQGLLLSKAAQAGQNATIWQPAPGAMDASEVIIWLLAVGTAVGGALWAGADYQADLTYLSSPQTGAAVRSCSTLRLTYIVAVCDLSLQGSKSGYRCFSMHCLQTPLHVDPVGCDGLPGRPHLSVRLQIDAAVRASSDVLF